jgi:hypothetical protein
MMTEAPNPADFSVNAKPDKYRVVIRVAGSVCVEITAASESDARLAGQDEADAILAMEPPLCELDEIDEAEVSLIRKEPDLYRVLRDGRPMQVSHLVPGDMPRAPDQYGF